MRHYPFEKTSGLLTYSILLEKRIISFLTPLPQKPQYLYLHTNAQSNCLGSKPKRAYKLGKT
jgi:hypothetical protein